MNKIFKISVGELVAFSCMRGDIDSRFSSNSSALEGARLHRKIQKNAGARYIPEYSLSFEIEDNGLNIKVQGRADGIITPLNDESFCIDEIKTTKKNLEEIIPLEVHIAQAKIYAYIYGKDNGLEKMGLRISYCNVITEDIRYFNYEYAIKELENFFYELLFIYSKKLKDKKNHMEERDISLSSVKFPFLTYRKYQRELAVATYRSLRDEKKLFLQAPTGIGKSVGTIFPSLKVLGEKNSDKLFYLTSKTTVRTVAEENLKLLKNFGAKIITLSLTAKEKLCFMEKVRCNPDYCPYAKGYYDRLREAVDISLKRYDSFTREVIIEVSKENMLCPFEFQLDISFDADVIVCDYNYLFDPNASLKRFFGQDVSKGDYFFLIDEAHNLPDRGRDMFSAEITNNGLINLQKEFKDVKEVHKALGKIINMFRDIEDEFLFDKNIVSSVGRKLPKKGFEAGRYFLKHVEERLTENNNEDRDEQLLEVYFQILKFLKIEEIYNEGYRFWVRDDEGLRVRLQCIDPSFLINEMVKKGIGTVFFSATMAPIKYFKALLGFEDSDNTLVLGSPFDKKKKLVLLAGDVDTRYFIRERSYKTIAKYIYLLISKKVGNYMIFFPSYKYMEDVFNVYTKCYFDTDKSVCFKQDGGMSEKAREDFLKKFDANNTVSHIGFCVMGGIFSEGIDLKGDKLIGVAIIGVGLPQICTERNMIADYFKEKELDGYEYSYTYPGINKVLQSIGRLIRTENDKGVVLLMDNRYNELKYQLLLPTDMFPMERVSCLSIEKKLDAFWEKS
ncbi:MAG: ATP-dependent DNA helicase [Filifactoraceae bacterium]